MSKVLSNYKIITGFLLTALLVVMFSLLRVQGPAPEPISSLEVQQVTPTATSTTEATPTQSIPEQGSTPCDAECAGYLFFIGGEEALTRVNLEKLNEVEILQAISAGSGFAPFDLSPFANEIVYVIGEGVEQDIALIDFNGDTIGVLVQDDVQKSAPRFSPSGDKVAFSTFSNNTYDISIVDLEGKVLDTFDLNTCRDEIDWLDDDHIVFVECVNQTDLSAINIITGEIISLTNDAGDELAPNVRSDGGKIVFSCRSATQDDLEICLLDVASGNMQRLTDNDEEELSPSWSTSGNWIVYSTSEGIYKMKEDGSWNEGLYSFGMIGSSPLFWDVPQVDRASSNEVISEGVGTFQEMTSFECSECHFTVHQTHMERGIITTEHICQDCHTILDEIHVGVAVP